MRGVLDTSVLIAIEQRRGLRVERLPERRAISVVTLAELELGAHLANDEPARTVRTETFSRACSEYIALPVDRRVATMYAEITAAARRLGRRPPVQDMWIAATAKAHAVAVYTQDADFDATDGVEVVRV